MAVPALRDLRLINLLRMNRLYFVWRIIASAFVMERKYSIDTLPAPNDFRIRIREVPERIMAVQDGEPDNQTDPVRLQTNGTQLAVI